MFVVMTRVQELAAVAAHLDDDQLAGLVAFARYLKGESVYATAPPEALASIERGLEQAQRGETAPSSDVFRRLRDKHGLGGA
jgi:predicted transcriptional regulator